MMRSVLNEMVQMCHFRYNTSALTMKQQRHAGSN